ncbi:MAG TPA: hypothetical protein VFY13_02110 [Luteolibacter sp.]|nr:hypothetical protein [Luteolibacter sp.]
MKFMVVAAHQTPGTVVAKGVISHTTSSLIESPAPGLMPQDQQLMSAHLTSKTAHAPCLLAGAHQI